MTQEFAVPISSALHYMLILLRMLIPSPQADLLNREKRCRRGERCERNRIAGTEGDDIADDIPDLVTSSDDDDDDDAGNAFIRTYLHQNEVQDARNAQKGQKVQKVQEVHMMQEVQETGKRSPMSMWEGNIELQPSSRILKAPLFC